MDGEFGKLPILVSYFLHILLKSLPKTLETLESAYSYFLVSWLIKLISKADLSFLL